MTAKKNMKVEVEPEEVPTYSSAKPADYFQKLFLVSGVLKDLPEGITPEDVVVIGAELLSVAAKVAA